MKKLLQNSTFALAVIGSVVLLNVISLRAFKRFDATRDGAYTLSQATKDTLNGLEDPVTVTAYFTEKLPPPYSGNARYVRDLLQEFRSQSHGKVSFEFIDPSPSEEKGEKREVKRDIFGRTFREPTELERELGGHGIQPVEIRVVEEDEVQTRRAYMGILIKHAEKKEVIPLVQSVNGLEFDLTSMIRKLTRKKAPVVAILQGHDEPKFEEKLRQLNAVLGQTYQVRPLELAGKDKIDDDVDGLLVIGPKAPLGVAEQKAIDQFLMRGKSVGMFIDSIRVDPRTLENSPVEHGLAPLLSSWGVTLGDKLVADGQSYAQVNVQEQRGGMMIQMGIPYPFIPMVKRLTDESPVSKGLGNVTFPFVTAVQAKAEPGREVATLALSTQKSWLEGTPYNIDARRDWRAEQVTPDGPHALMVQLQGKFTSHFASEASQSQSGATPTLAASAADGRLIVAGSSTWLQDDYLQRPNVILLANITDWLVLDPALLAMRSRAIASAPLRTEISGSTRNAVKFGNALGLPLLLIVFGLVRWRVREARRATATVEG